MSLKSEFCRNDDDFYETNGHLKELTVTITLCEYRNLITELARADEIFPKIKEENKNLKKQVEDLSKYIFASNPSIGKSLSEITKEFANVCKNEDDADTEEVSE